MDIHELILSAASHGIVAIDVQRRIPFANDAAVELLGKTRESFIGSLLRETLIIADGDGVAFAEDECPLHRALTMGQRFRSDEYTLTNHAGECFPAELELIPVQCEGAEIQAVLSFADVTERRTIQQQMVQSQKLQSIGELASGIAHEINTPIQYINDNLFFLQSSFSDLSDLTQQTKTLLDTLDNEEVARQYNDTLDTLDVDYLLGEIPTAIEQTIEGTNRVATIVRAMKEFAHPAESSKAPVDLNRVIRSSITVARNEWKYVAEVNEQLDESIPMVLCQGSELHQVVLNLIINAAHAVAEKVADGSDKGTISISSGEEHDHVVIRIADTGGGIPEEIHPRIFDPFFTTKAVGKGTGQGLAIAHSVVKKHGGAIHFETAVGQGTTFVIRLPIATHVESSNTSEEESHEAHLVC